MLRAKGASCAIRTLPVEWMMSREERDREVARNLMRLALALLDRAYEGDAAARLRHALEVLPSDGSEEADKSGSGQS